MDENQQDTANPPALPDRTSEERMKYEPMAEAPGFAATVDAVLKYPGQILYEWQEGRTRAVGLRLAAIAAACFVVFGFIMGLFSGGTQLWAVPMKVFGGTLVSAAITLPSLYVFSCLGGHGTNLKQAGGALLLGISLAGLILLGLGPVAWIFTQSTDSAWFMGFLLLSFWLVAVFFGCSLIFRCARATEGGTSPYLVLWAAIFIVVTLQMSTSLRPIIGPAGDRFLPEEKLFFLEHWFGWMDDAD